MLAAARDHEINLFGELGEGQRNNYFTRAATSLKQHTFTDIGGDFDPDLDATGQRLVFASTRHNAKPDLYMKSVDGVAVTQLTSDPASDVQASFSSDGNRVAFASDRGGNWDIWVISTHGGQPVQITSGPADEVHPSWSPDGSQLVFCSLPVRGGQWELWMTDATAGGSQRFIGYGLFPEWSPTSDKIVYQRAREQGSRWFSIWTLTLVDGDPRYPTELAASAREAMILPTWSPGGEQIAFAGTESLLTPDPTASPMSPSDNGYFDIWIVGADGRGRVRLTDGFTVNYSPTFSPDGRVYFTSSRSGSENVWSQLPAGPMMTDLGQDTITGGSRGVGTARVVTGPRARTVSEKSVVGNGRKTSVSDKRTP